MSLEEKKQYGFLDANFVNYWFFETASQAMDFYAFLQKKIVADRKVVWEEILSLEDNPELVEKFHIIKWNDDPNQNDLPSVDFSCYNREDNSVPPSVITNETVYLRVGLNFSIICSEIYLGLLEHDPKFEMIIDLPTKEEEFREDFYPEETEIKR